MPRTGQIIPEWLHPHEAVYINDNTRYEDTAFQNSGPVMLHVFRSSKGVDNKLKYYDSITDWVNEYGLPDYRRYGQPGYNAYVALSTGLANSQSMRIMPKDASYANVVLLAKYQKKDGKLQMKFEAKTVTGILNIDDLQAYVDRMESTEPDESGYTTLPLMSFWSRGRGVYGNDYRVRISRDKGADKENNYVNYVIELLTMEYGSLSVMETYNVSFYVDAIDPNSNFTLFVNDIVDDENGKGSGRFNCSLMSDNLEKIFKVYTEVFEEATVLKVEEVAALPPTSLPDPNTLFIKSNNEVWVYDDVTLHDYKLYDAAPNMQSTDKTVAALPEGATLPEGADLYIVSEDSVYTYNTTTGLATTEQQYIEVENEAAIEEGSAVDQAIYKTKDNNKYFLVTKAPFGKEDVTAKTTAFVVDDETMPAGCIFAKAKVLYKNTVSSTYTVLDEATHTMNDVTENCKEVGGEELPSTELYKPNTIYRLTEEDGDKPEGSEWIYSEEEHTWVAADSSAEPEVMPYTLENWDIFGYNKFTQEYDPYFSFDGGIESVSILSIEGLGMESGNDGSFSDDTEAAVRDEAVEQAYLSAFTGEFDKAILSKRRAPIDLMLDANYPLAVKKQMVALAISRYDAACHLDTNLINNVADLETFNTQISDLRERIMSVDAGMFKTTDPITGKVIPVTMTLWLSSKIPMHFNVYGNHTPLAGEEYATLSGYQKNSIRPEIDADDSETKELLYDKLRFNYVECVDENTYMRGTQQTSQNFWSDLSEENNMLVLLEIKRKIERLAAKNRYKWADATELRLFKESCEEIFSSYKGVKCVSLDIDVKMNDWEKTRYIVHVYLAVVFRTFQKRSIIEIDVNPRA